jgi:hypothetical protein
MSEEIGAAQDDGGVDEIRLDDYCLLGFKLELPAGVRGLELMRVIGEWDSSTVHVLLAADTMDFADSWGHQLGEVAWAIARDYYGCEEWAVAEIVTGFKAGLQWARDGEALSGSVAVPRAGTDENN